MKRVFITGGTGFLGVNLVQGLLKEGYHVSALVRHDNTPLHKLQGVNCILGDLDHLESLDFPSIDICLHLAWAGVNRDEISNPVVQKNNVDNEKKLFSIAKENGCTLFIDAGSRQEYSFADEAMDESFACNPVSEYGKGKLQAYFDISHMSGDVKYIHPRIFSIYGYGDHPWSLINSAIEKLHDGETMDLGLCTQKWSFLYIADFVNAILSIIEESDNIPNNEIINIGSNDNRILRNFVNEIKTIENSSSTLNYGAFIQNPESIKSIMCNATKLTKLTGWKEQYTFGRGINEILNLKYQA